MRRSHALWVVICLAGLGIASLAIPGSPVYLPNLLVSSKNYRGRSAAAWAAELKSEDSKVRHQAIHALGTFGPEAGAAIPALATILREDQDPETRSNAAHALSKMAPATATVVPALAQALEDEEPFVRMHAAFALFRLHAAARPASAALLKALKDQNNQTNLKTFQYTIQEMSALALGRATAGSDEAVVPLIALLAAADSFDTRLAVARALGEIGPPAKPAEAALRKLLTDEHSVMREAAQESLEKIGAARAAEPQKKQGAKSTFPSGLRALIQPEFTS